MTVQTIEKKDTVYQPDDMVDVVLNVEGYPILVDPDAKVLAGGNAFNGEITFRKAERGRDIPDEINEKGESVQIGGHETNHRTWTFKAGAPPRAIPYKVYAHICGDRQRYPRESDIDHQRRLREELTHVRANRMSDLYRLPPYDEKNPLTAPYRFRDLNDMPPVLTIVGSDYVVERAPEPEIVKQETAKVDWSKKSWPEIREAVGALKDEIGLEFNHFGISKAAAIYFLENKKLPGSEGDE